MVGGEASKVHTAIYPLLSLLPTPTEDEDYLSLTATLEWHYDSPSVVQCVSVPIINDECVEEKEEVFTVSLSTEQACVQLGANLTTVTIQDDDGEYSILNSLV